MPVYDVRRGEGDFQRPGGAPRSSGSLFPVLIVFGFALMVTVGLIGLTGLAGLYIVLAFASVLAFAGLHYLLWGWWLMNKIRSQQSNDDEDEE